MNRVKRIKAQRDGASVMSIRSVAGKCVAIVIVLGSFALLAWTLPLILWAGFK